jgi:DNA polymerase I-like protein with 3'-5' exonuclease and polymerase domains
MAYTLKLQELTGNIIDVWSNQDIERNVSKLGLAYPLTEKGNPSFEGDWLKSQDNDIFKCISHIRSLDRGGGVFIEKKILEIAKNGRVYPTFRQSRTDDGGTRSGRFASANPNMQQVPARDAELAPLIRGLFIPEQGTQWGVFDYSQQEPRTTVHYASVSNIAGGKEALDKYVNDSSTDFHQMVADATGLSRTTAKTMNLGLAYGMGKAKMAESLGVTVREATTIYDKYHANVPFMKALATKCSNLAETRGWIKTLSGRKRRYELWGPKKWTAGMSPKKKADAIIEFEPPIVRYFTYRAMNAVIQGTAADMLKFAMIDVFKAGYVPHLTIHDELDISIETEKQAKEISDIMCNCLANHGIEFSVPLKVDVKLGPSWGEAKKI